jgi:hypothetical protein
LMKMSVKAIAAISLVFQHDPRGSCHPAGAYQ